MQKAF